MKRIGIVHYLPLEYYPPVTNLLDCMVLEEDMKIKVWSCHNVKNRQPYSAGRGIHITRTIFPKASDTRLFRLFKYVIFNLHFFFGLLRFRPEKILYFDTYSVGPVYWYLKFFGKKTELFVHNHEYFDSDWYQNGMAVVKYYHHLEKS